MEQMICGIMRDLDAERKAYDHRSREIAKASESLRQAAIYRICQRLELESDEFMTREEKAQAIIKA